MTLAKPQVEWEEDSLDIESELKPRDSQSMAGNATGNDSVPEDTEELETDNEIPLAELKSGSA